MSNFKKTKFGLVYDAIKRILDNDFWSKITKILKVFKPIIKVLRLVDGDKKPTMGFVYDVIDRVKQSI